MLPSMIQYKKICILRLSAIGDVTHVLSLVQALKTDSPQTAITWIIGTLEHKLLQDLPGVEFIVYDKRSGISGLLALRKTLAAA